MNNHAFTVIVQSNFMFCCDPAETLICTFFMLPSEHRIYETFWGYGIGFMNPKTSLPYLFFSCYHVYIAIFSLNDES